MHKTNTVWCGVIFWKASDKDITYSFKSMKVMIVNLGEGPM